MKKIISIFMVFVFISFYSVVPFNFVHADTLDPVGSVNRHNFVITSLLVLGVVATSYKQIDEIASNVIANCPDLNPLNSVQGHMLVKNGQGLITATSDTFNALKTYVNSLKSTGSITVNSTVPNVNLGSYVGNFVTTITGDPTHVNISYNESMFVNGTITHTIPLIYAYKDGTYQTSAWPSTWDYWYSNTSCLDHGGFPFSVYIDNSGVIGGTLSVDIPRDITQNLHSVDGTLRVNPNAISDVDGVTYNTASPYAGSQALDDVLTGKVGAGSLDDVIGNTISVPITYPVTIPAVDGYVPSAVPVVGPVIDFFHIDFPAISASMDFTDIWKAHFKPFFDLGTAFSNISNVPTDSTGKFYMVIPTAMGGDGLSHCVLDLTAGALFISWARTFIKFSLWLALGFYILRLVDPKFTIH